MLLYYRYSTSTVHLCSRHAYHTPLSWKPAIHRCRDRYHQTFEKNDFSPLLIVVTIGVVLALPEVIKILLDLVNQPLQPLLQLPFLLWLVKGLAKQDTIV